jgi:hypothetical protein
MNVEEINEIKSDRGKVTPLCVASRAEGGAYRIELRVWHGEYARLDECPLGLSTTEARRLRCPCKVREQVTDTRNDEGAAVPVKVLTCTFPQTWNGDTVRKPEAFAAYLRRSRKE